MNTKRRLWLFQQAVTATIFFLLFSLYIFLVFSRENPTTNLPDFPGKSAFPVKVYLYNLPRRFTYGVTEHYWSLRGCHVSSPVADVSDVKFPRLWHSAEWDLYSDLTRPEKERTGSPVFRVSDPSVADLFFVPFFSSLSLVVERIRAESGSGRRSEYSDPATQEDLISWLEEQVYWRRHSGKDHVFVLQNPNAMGRVRERVNNSVLLGSGMEQWDPVEAPLTVDVSLSESSWNSEKRKALLFFVTGQYGKEHGSVSDFIFEALENEEDAIAKDEATLANNQVGASSKFCLVSADASCRLCDAIVSLCIPVIVRDEIELPFEDVIDYAKIAIFVESQDVVKKGYLVRRLKNVTTERILEYQQELKKVKRYFNSKDSNVTVNQIWRRLVQKLPFVKTMINRDKLLRRVI